MTQMARYQTSIAALDAQLSAFQLVCDRESPPPADELAATRWAIIRTLCETAVFLEKHLLAPLEASGHADLIAEGVAISATKETAMRQLVAHTSRWSPDAVVDDWRGYRRAIHQVHRLIRDYFRWETALLPPMFAALEGASAAPKRNWARPVWAVHDTLYRLGDTAAPGPRQ